MTLLITDFPQFVDMVYKYGALPLLMLAVYVLWRKVGALEAKADLKAAAHLADIKAHGEIYAGLLETTNFANIETRRLIKEGLERVNRELEIINTN